MPNGLIADEKYAVAWAKRQAYIDEVVKSDARRKIVVAGPGTGKTYLFRKILEGKKNCLTLTFVNSLVSDLSLELCGLSEVKTLHSFALGILAKLGNPQKIFPKLSAVMRHDARILLGQDIDFDALFHNLAPEGEITKFYLARREYYGHFGYADVIYSAVRFLQQNKDKIPSFGIVIVDEFQDFNKLEVSLIELLAEKSPILIAGDDDQALYEFKNASTEHIRQRHGGSIAGYTAFALPYCSRSTRAIVEAVNDVIRRGKADGHLKGRIDKQYEYFEDMQKDQDSDANPRIVFTQRFAAQVPWFIENQLIETAKRLRTPFDVLIISPTKLTARSLVRALKEKGLERIEFVDRQEQREPTLFDGLNILLEVAGDNLGWWITAKHLLQPPKFEELIRTSYENSSKALLPQLDKATKKKAKKLLKGLRAIREGNNIIDDDLMELTRALGLDVLEPVKAHIKERVSATSKMGANRSIRNLPIKVTTVASSKGLAAQYVFITHFDDRLFIKGHAPNSITDQDICNFLVALTRARTKVCLISTDQKSVPTFLEWIEKNRIVRI
jgi:superfamily I DNA/RNA helicase